ncbi:MAG: NAD(P)-dependent alcohol dehydrogenase [Thermoleophilia bacterium]|nr:NAD(P)-dependent alcohol dehydrogenase [Thermoleophilia bacterium]
MGKITSAAVLYQPGTPYSMEEVELDDPKAGEVLVRIEACGICHTDATMQYIMPMPCVIGHEGVGIIEEVGPGVQDLKPGDRVILSWPACGKCLNCLSGQRYICEEQFGLLFAGSRPDGSRTIKLKGEWIGGAFFQQSSFANHAIASVSTVVKVDKDLPPELLAALPCGVMTGAGSVLNTMGMGPQDDLLVFGAGAVGLAAVMAAKLAGVYPIIVVDIKPERLDLALEVGATHVINAAQEDVVAKVREILPQGIRFAFDASGSPAPWPIVANLFRYGGIFGVAGVPSGMTLGERPTEMFSKAVRVQFIMGGHSIPQVFIPRMIEWYKQGRFPVDRLIMTFPFSQINEAFEASHEGKAVKPVLLMS